MRTRKTSIGFFFLLGKDTTFIALKKTARVNYTSQKRTVPPDVYANEGH